MKLFEVLMGFETPVFHYTAMCLVRAEADWLAIMESEERVRMVFHLVDTLPVNVVRVRELSAEEGWRLALAKGPTWTRVSKEDVARMKQNLN